MPEFAAVAGLGLAFALGWVGILYLFSRRWPVWASLSACIGLTLAGAVGIAKGAEWGAGSGGMAALSLLVAGAGGVALSLIDCFRVEAWRNAGTQESVRAGG